MCIRGKEMSKPPVFIYNKNELGYRFHDEHPFNQKRLESTVALLQAAGALTAESIISPKLPSEQELLRVHTKEYVETVQALSSANLTEQWILEASRHGLDT